MVGPERTSTSEERMAAPGNSSSSEGFALGMRVNLKPDSMERRPEPSLFWVAPMVARRLRSSGGKAPHELLLAERISFGSLFQLGKAELFRPDGQPVLGLRAV